MPSCKEISELVSASMDGNLPMRRRLSIRFHILMCSFCRRYEKQLLLLRIGTKHYAEPDENPVEASLSAAASERLKRALERKP
ncbi:MAG: zf-HC2 domain-containing protein [Verrucomicrobia bacterium]|nr:zf-HC2 domain-containing protein [Verrucomicrobiota bacterium]